MSGAVCVQRSMCLCPLHELSAAGASGSVFYASDDDEFIIKTVQKREAEFLLKLLPGYFLVRASLPPHLSPSPLSLSLSLTHTLSLSPCLSVSLSLSLCLFQVVSRCVHIPTWTPEPMTAHKAFTCSAFHVHALPCRKRVRRLHADLKIFYWRWRLGVRLETRPHPFAHLLHYALASAALRRFVPRGPTRRDRRTLSWCFRFAFVLMLMRPVIYIRCALAPLCPVCKRTPGRSWFPSGQILLRLRTYLLASLRALNRCPRGRWELQVCLLRLFPRFSFSSICELRA